MKIDNLIKIILLLLISSCTNNYEVSSEMLSSSFGIYAVTDRELDGTLEFNGKEVPIRYNVRKSQTRYSVVTLFKDTLKGYDTSKEIKRTTPLYMQFSRKVCGMAQIPYNRIYDVIEWEIGKECRRANFAEVSPTPNVSTCGLVETPEYHSWELGYNYTRIEQNIYSFTTRIYQVVKDSKGNYFDDLWLPMKKENLLWPYAWRLGVIQFD